MIKRVRQLLKIVSTKNNNNKIKNKILEKL